jgi:hypothetical protein
LVRRELGNRSEAGGTRATRPFGERFLESHLEPRLLFGCDCGPLLVACRGGDPLAERPPFELTGELRLNQFGDRRELLARRDGRVLFVHIDLRRRGDAGVGLGVAGERVATGVECCRVPLAGERASLGVVRERRPRPCVDPVRHR